MSEKTKAQELAGVLMDYQECTDADIDAAASELLRLDAEVKRLSTTAAQVLRDMQAQGVLIEWQTVLAEAINGAAPAPVAQPANPTMTRDELVAAAESIGMRFPAPVAQPLTLEQINHIERSAEWPENSLRNIGPRDWGRLLVVATRAIERAHGIGG